MNLSDLWPHMKIELVSIGPFLVFSLSHTHNTYTSHVHPHATHVIVLHTHKVHRIHVLHMSREITHMINRD